MESDKEDILGKKEKNLFERLFRKNILIVILFIIVGNGYSNIPGMNELLTFIFSSHICRTLITFILFFQMLDHIADSILWTVIITTILYLVEFNHYHKNL